jgi:hypothetical protein
MTKKGGVQKAVEAIKKLVFNKGFRADIRKSRQMLGIPPDGFLEWEEANDFARKNTMDLFGHTVGLLEKYDLPLTYWIELSRYIESNNPETGRTAADTTIAIEYPDSEYSTDLGKLYTGFKQPYVKVYILDASSKEEVAAQINKNWKEIEQSLRNQGWQDRGTRSAKNWLRDSRILQLSEKNKDELEEMLEGNPGVYTNKVDLIAAIMHQEHGYSGVTNEIVKKITTHNSRLKRSRRK